MEDKKKATPGTVPLIGSGQRCTFILCDSSEVTQQKLRRLGRKRAAVELE
jgi:hypothetical protein